MTSLNEFATATKKTCFICGLSAEMRAEINAAFYGGVATVTQIMNWLQQEHQLQVPNRNKMKNHFEQGHGR